MPGRDDQPHRSFRTPARGTPVTDEETRRLAEVVAHAIGEESRRKPVSTEGGGSGEWHTALAAQMATVNATLVAQGAMLKETNDTVKDLRSGQQEVLLQLAEGSGRMNLIENNIGHMEVEQTRIDDELKLHLRRCSGGVSGGRSIVARSEENKAAGGWISAAALPKILIAVGTMSAAIIGAFWYGVNHAAPAAPSAQVAPAPGSTPSGPAHP